MKFTEALDAALGQLDQSKMAYRLILDEPVGIAVGFKPKSIKVGGAVYPDSLELDQFKLVGDDGGNAVFVSKDGTSLIINGTWQGVQAPRPPSPQFGYPEPQDLMIWRSEQEYLEWLRDYYE